MFFSLNLLLHPSIPVLDYSWYLIANIFVVLEFNFDTFFSFFQLFSTIASALPATNNQTTKQLGRNEYQVLLLSTRFKSLPTKFRVVKLFGEAGKAIRRIHGWELLRDNGPDLVTIRHLTMNFADAGTAYL